MYHSGVVGFRNHIEPKETVVRVVEVDSTSLKSDTQSNEDERKVCVCVCLAR